MKKVVTAMFAKTASELCKWFLVTVPLPVQLIASLTYIARLSLGKSAVHLSFAL